MYARKEENTERQGRKRRNALCCVDRRRGNAMGKEEVCMSVSGQRHQKPLLRMPAAVWL
jgi:hypothetical protein